MSRILKHSLILLAILTVHFSIIEYVLPYYWGAEATVSKHTLNGEKIKNANILFFGSSRTLYHVNARLFSNKTKTKAYNLGIQDGRTFEIANQITHFVKNAPTSKEKRYIIYELCPFENLSRKKTRNTNRIRHFWNFNTFYKSVKHYLAIEDYSQLGYSIKNFLSYFFKIDVVKEYYLMRKHKEVLLNEGKFGMEEMSRCNGCFANANISMARKEKTAKQVEKKKERIVGYYKDTKRLSAKDLILKNRLIEEVKEIKEFTQKHNFDLVIVNQTGSQLYQIAAFQELKANGFHAIDLGDPREYPAFYDPKNLFDIAHLTKKGSNIFTTSLVKEFKKLQLLSQ